MARGRPAATVSSTPHASATRCAASTASPQVAGASGAPPARASRARRRAAPRRGAAAAGAGPRPPRARRRSVDGRRPDAAVRPSATAASGRNTRPVSKSARLSVPRPRLRRATPKSPGSSVVRSSGSSSDSGLARRNARRRASSAGSPIWSCTSGDRNGYALHLDVPGAGQGQPDPAAQPLLQREPGADRRGRQLGRDVLVPVQSGDLLDEVGGDRQVRPPRGRESPSSSCVPRALVDGASHRPSRWRTTSSSLKGIPTSAPTCAAVEVDHRFRRRDGADDGASRHPHGAAELARAASPPARRPPPAARCRRLGRTVGTPRSAACGVGRCGRCAAGSKCAASMHDVGAGGVDLGGRAAHHPGDADRAGVVGDQQVVGVERRGRRRRASAASHRPRRGAPRSAPVSRLRS